MKRVLIMACCLSISSVYAAEAQAPSVEFLEFMGEWEGTDGQWQDPTQLVDVSDADLRPQTQSQSGTESTPVSDVNSHISNEVKHDDN